MVSLLHLAVITEEGVAFQSPHDGRDMLLTPEHSIAIQNRLGAPWHGSLSPEPSGASSVTSPLIVMNDAL